MKRKKWTPKTNIDNALLQSREKRKWQIALRRYILEEHKCIAYAPYFGLDNKMIRIWIELQFQKGQSWDTFSSAWQFDHIVPVAFFDFTNDDDLRLCWNFTNIKVASTDKAGSSTHGATILVAKRHFESLHIKTGYPLCAAMINKINQLQEAQLETNNAVEDFLIQNSAYLAAAQNFTAEDFERLNTGTNFSVIMAEKEFLKKFGA